MLSKFWIKILFIFQAMQNGLFVRINLAIFPVFLYFQINFNFLCCAWFDCRRCIVHWRYTETWCVIKHHIVNTVYTPRRISAIFSFCHVLRGQLWCDTTLDTHSAYVPTNILSTYRLEHTDDLTTQHTAQIEVYDSMNGHRSTGNVIGGQAHP